MIAQRSQSGQINDVMLTVRIQIRTQGPSSNGGQIRVW